MSKTSQSPLEPYQTEIEGWVSQGWTNAEIEGALKDQGVPSSERSIRRAKKRWGLSDNKGGSDPEPASISVRGDSAEITGKPTTKLSRPEDLMLERGLDPEEWEVVSIIINEWDGATKKGGGEKVTGKHTLRQLKITLKRKVPIELISPARLDGPKFRSARPQPGYSRSYDGPNNAKRVVLVGDQQAPYYEEKLHRAFCQFLGDYQPHSGVLIGDTIDLPDISRHPINPERDVTVQECIDTGYMILKEYRESFESCEWQKLAGNHDERLRRIVVDNIRQIYGLRRAQIPDETAELPVMDVGHLLRLDELDIEFVRPDGDYEHTQVNLSDHLAARHGWIARKGSGTSALATLEHLGFSVVVGHTHRQSLVHKTTHDINGKTSTLAACETGCMCRIDEGLGYAVAPDWQQGFATAEIWPNGTFKLDLATFVNGVLYHRNKRYL